MPDEEKHVKRRTLTHTAPRLVLVGAIGTVLASCGGGSGDGTFTADENQDGIADVTLDGVDQNNDGQDDVDVNGDGVPDFDINQDGIRDTDVNNDGSLDESVLDEFGLLAGFDTSDPRDGVADIGIDGQPITAPPPTGGELTCPGSGSDASSADDDWSNNCTLSSGATSYYTRGVQRILYCLGFDGGATNVGAFADAQYGEGTAAQVRAYQASEGINDDGIVGGQTWGRLRDELEPVAGSADPVTRDLGYRITGADASDPACGDRVQFYRTLRDGSDTEFGGWTIADNAGSATRVEFSIRNPFQSAD